MKLKLILALLLSMTLNFRVFAEEKPKPNIVILLIDDLGWQDVKCYDIDEESPYETPNIDSLAKRGVLFWEGYSPAPTCSPSRAAILSGNHPARANMTHVSGGQPPTPYNENFRMMAPYYNGRMPEGEQTIARVLQENGYATGHTGKWHVAVNHNAYPQPTDQGFDYSRHDLGVSRLMNPDRLSEFATNDSDDIYQLDSEGFPHDQTTQDALNFLEDNKHKPFFLYYASWLVHTPIQTRSLDLLTKYCNKLGIDVPSDPGNLSVEGQGNPYYCAMVEQLDHYVGLIINYLDNTDDPRWPGHKLSENTFLFFTSDNGGYERPAIERITDNKPLDLGKISAKEGGTRVPFIVTGPGIEHGVESNVMVNGLDLYPTILSLLDIEKPDGKNLDGTSLKNLLLQDPTNPEMVVSDSGNVRNTMVWHFPHGHANESTIRIGDFKLIRNYDYINNPANEKLDLYRLYHSNDSNKIRGDIEEAHRLNSDLPELTQRMDEELTAILEEMEAQYSHYNPDYPSSLPNKDKAPKVNSYIQKDDIIEFTYTENGAEVIKANLIYTMNGGDKYEEYFKSEAVISSADNKIIASLPEGTTHVFLNLIDENNFLVSYPKPMFRQIKTQTGDKYSVDAIEIDTFQSKKKGNNIAPYGIASQSSTDFGGEASRAIDRNTDGIYSHGSVTHTETEYKPWWQAELDQSYIIDSIIVYNRTDDCCIERLSNYSVCVIDNSQDTTFAISFTSFPDPKEIIRTGGTEGSRIKISLEENGSLNLAEVEVYKEEVPRHSVAIQVLDDSLKYGLHNVFLSINNQYYNTDKNGRVNIKLTEGRHDLTLKKAGYSPISIRLELTKDTAIIVNMKLAEYLLEFNLIDSATGIGVSDAIVYLEDLQFNSDSNGNLGIKLREGEYQYKIVKSGYYNIDGEIMLKMDTIISLLMNSATSSSMEEIKQKIVMHPNPVINQLVVESPLCMQNIFVYNILGEKIESHNTINERYVLNTDNYPNGIYLLKVNLITGEQISGKFLIRR